MKKEYNKPTVEIMAIEGNDVICGDCAVKVGQNNSLKKKYDSIYGDGDGILTREEFDTLFAKEDDCLNKDNTYCKFQSIGDKVVAWS